MKIIINMLSEEHPLIVGDEELTKIVKTQRDRRLKDFEDAFANVKKSFQEAEELFHAMTTAKNGKKIIALELTFEYGFKFSSEKEGKK